MSGFEKANDKDLWYTGLKSSIAHSGVDSRRADLEPRDRQDLGFGFLTFVIMYCFVPMSLYVTFDLVRHPCLRDGVELTRLTSAQAKIDQMSASTGTRRWSTPWTGN